MYQKRDCREGEGEGEGLRGARKRARKRWETALVSAIWGVRPRGAGESKAAA